MWFKYWLYAVLWCSPFAFSFCQSDIKITGKVKSQSFDKKIGSMLDFSIPVLSVQEARSRSNIIYLDAREQSEYNVSHIPGAQYIGDKDWTPRSVTSITKDQLIVVYCSIGYRSEKIASKIKALGYNKVYNLYGSIFEWANEGFPLEDYNHKPTQKLHTYSKKWSTWVQNKKIEKVW